MTAHRVEEIGGSGSGLFLVSNGLYQSLLLDAGEGAVVVDAPPSLARALPFAIAETIGKPVTHVLYSHSHGDHIGAAGTLVGPGTEIIAHERTAALLARHADPNRLAPTRTFTDSLTLQLGRHEVRLSHRGANHSPDNAFLHFPAQRTLMLVDVVLAGTAPFRGLTGATDVPGFLRAHRQVLAYDVDTVVGGHFTRVGNREDVELALAYLRDLVELTTGALRGTDLASIAADLGPGHPYRLAEEFDARVAAPAAAALVERWTGRLEGVEVFARSQITAMADSLRWDYNVPAGGAPPVP
jgi:glyoxylase-like metal-dependent hydrolase (beta-lactamase superfamily II)